MEKQIEKFIADSEAKIHKACIARDGARTEAAHLHFTELVYERKEVLRRFKMTFEVPLSPADIYDIAFINKKYNDPAKWDSTVALIDAGVIRTVACLARYFDIKLL